MADRPTDLGSHGKLDAVTEPVGQTIDDGKGRIFPCEGCGSDLKFHIGQQQLKCPYCGFQKALKISDDARIEEQDFRSMLERVRELRVQGGHHHDEGKAEIRCESCGGITFFYGTLTSSECPYCGSPIQLANVHDAEDRIRVDGVLPFLIERQTAHDNLKRWVQGRWFAPNEFLERGADGKFQGVYLPYWTYDTMTFNRYRGERGEHYWETQTYRDSDGKTKTRQIRKTRWYPASGNFQRFFDDVSVIAAHGFSRDLICALEPWPVSRMIPFTQEVLAGYLARTYEVDLENGFQFARERIDDEIRSEVRVRIGGDTQRIYSIDTQYGAITYKHVLLPIWLLAYRFHNKTFQVVVNAATGEVQGERPYSWVKITLTALAGLLVAGGITLIVSYLQ